MNKVASECCGSCGWYCWNSYLENYNCHNSEIVKQHKQDDFIPESLCVPNYYSPRLPILITDLPGVKELVEAAYRAGFRDGAGCGENNTNHLKRYEENSVYEYMKALKAK